MIDVGAYLDRIGCNGAATLGTVHRAHVTSIPFENLDAWSGRPVSLDLDEVERTLVVERQGGYCFEHNLLLQAELQQLGYDVELLLARARTGGGPVRSDPARTSCCGYGPMTRRGSPMPGLALSAVWTRFPGAWAVPIPSPAGGSA